MLKHPTSRAQSLINDALEVVITKCIKSALNGDPGALKVIMDRLVQPRRSSSLKFKLPPINTLEDFPLAYGAVLQAVTNGDLTSAEAEALGQVIGQSREAWELAKIMPLLQRLESRPAEETTPLQNPH